MTDSLWGFLSAQNTEPIDFITRLHKTESHKNKTHYKNIS